MALPTSRNTTYIAGVSEVKSADLNDIQDKIVDLNNRFTSEETCILGAKGNGPSATIGTDGSIISSSAGFIFIPVDLPVGTELTSMTFTGLRSGGTNPNYLIRETVNSTGAVTDTLMAIGTSASRESLTSAISVTMLTGRTYSLKVEAGGSSTATLFMVSVSWNRP